MDRIPCPLCSTAVPLTACGEHCYDGTCRRCRHTLAVVDLPAGVSVAVHAPGSAVGDSAPDDVVPTLFTVMKDVSGPKANGRPVPAVELKLSRKRPAGSRRAS